MGCSLVHFDVQFYTKSAIVIDFVQLRSQIFAVKLINIIFLITIIIVDDDRPE